MTVETLGEREGEHMLMEVPLPSLPTEGFLVALESELFFPFLN